MRRDMIGRMGGIILFGSFLVFHLLYVVEIWNSIGPVAKFNSLIITVTIILFLSVYLLRRKAVSYSQGFSEKIFPLFCALLPLIVYHDVNVLKYISTGSHSFPVVYFLFGLYVHEFLGWNIFSMILMIMGNTITFVGIFCLRRSFSIMVEAREPVYDGIYKYIRHPIYLGEIMAIIGTLIFRFSNINLILAVIFISGQIIRARLEERKLSETFPSYVEYKQKTGAFFPKLHLRKL